MQATAQKTKHALAGRLFLAGFLAMLLLPGPLWLALRGGVDSENHENRALAAFPAGVALQQWPAAFEDWLGDHAPFRNQWMGLNARINWALGSLDSTDVLRGKQNWLFLKDVSDSKSLSDYQGLTVYTEAEQQEFVQVLTQLQQALQRRGSRLAVVLAPAKEGVYSQYLPDSIPAVARPTRVQALAGALQGAGLAVVWPQQALIEASQGQQTYYKYDTHWNNAGAFLAAGQLLEALGLPHTPYAPALVAPQPGVQAPKDLANVSAAWALCTDDLYYEVDAPKARLASASADGYIARYQGQGQGALLLVRDSFGEALAPFAAAPFASALVLHGNALGAGALQSEQAALPDVVVLEAAERYSDNLLSQARAVLAWVQGLEG